MKSSVYLLPSSRSPYVHFLLIDVIKPGANSTAGTCMHTHTHGRLFFSLFAAQFNFRNLHDIPRSFHDFRLRPDDNLRTPSRPNQNTSNNKQASKREPNATRIRYPHLRLIPSFDFGLSALREESFEGGLRRSHPEGGMAAMLGFSGVWCKVKVNYPWDSGCARRRRDIYAWKRGSAPMWMGIGNRQAAGVVAPGNGHGAAYG